MENSYDKYEMESAKVDDKKTGKRQMSGKKGKRKSRKSKRS